jgi:hypothetical protein
MFRTQRRDELVKWLIGGYARTRSPCGVYLQRSRRAAPRSRASLFVSSPTGGKRQRPINQSASTMGLPTNDSWESRGS